MTHLVHNDADQELIDCRQQVQQLENTNEQLTEQLESLKAEFQKRSGDSSRLPSWLSWKRATIAAAVVIFILLLSALGWWGEVFGFFSAVGEFILTILALLLGVAVIAAVIYILYRMWVRRRAAVSKQPPTANKQEPPSGSSDQTNRTSSFRNRLRTTFGLKDRGGHS